MVAHESMVKSLLTSDAIRADLLRLYSRVCEGRISDRLDLVVLFTSAMVQLLEAQGTQLHTSVINKCLHATTDDHKGTAL